MGSILEDLQEGQKHYQQVRCSLPLTHRFEKEDGGINCYHTILKAPGLRR